MCHSTHGQLYGAVMHFQETSYISAACLPSSTPHHTTAGHFGMQRRAAAQLSQHKATGLVWQRPAGPFAGWRLVLTRVCVFVKVE
jgi:hypothetical protein